jgi:hypothetical protein
MLKCAGVEEHVLIYINRIALMVFLIAYALFEVPSNYLLKKLRPSVRHLIDKVIVHIINSPY